MQLAMIDLIVAAFYATAIFGPLAAFDCGQSGLAHNADSQVTCSKLSD